MQRPLEAERTTITETRVQTVATEFLKEYPGHAFCDECLAERLGLGRREIHRARIGLIGSTEYDQHVWFCSVCMRLTHVIHVAWLAGGTVDLTDAADTGS